MDKLTLLAANFVIIAVFAISFLVLANGKDRKEHWRFWSLANFLLGGSLALFIAETVYPVLSALAIPNFILVLSFMMHLLGAARFHNARISSAFLVGPPFFLAVITLIAFQSGQYALVYVATSILVASLAFSTALQYYRSDMDARSARFALVLAFSLIGIEDTVRSVEGMWSFANMGPGLPESLMVQIHLLLGLIFVTISGAFTLVLSYEQSVLEQREMARRDPLTGTYNRREFEYRVGKLLNQTPRQDFALLQLDLDHFKRFNDSFGHVAGDAALIRTCRMIQKHLRTKDCLARLGGEEFAILMPDISLAEAYKTSDTMRKRIAGMKMDDISPEAVVTISAGLYYGSGHDLTIAGLLELADRKLYESKKTGRNRISVVNVA